MLRNLKEIAEQAPDALVAVSLRDPVRLGGKSRYLGTMTADEAVAAVEDVLTEAPWSVVAKVQLRRRPKPVAG